MSFVDLMLMISYVNDNDMIEICSSLCEDVLQGQ